MLIEAPSSDFAWHIISGVGGAIFLYGVNVIRQQSAIISDLQMKIAQLEGKLDVLISSFVDRERHVK